ncbi:MAG: two-component system, NtrC family, sensor histidine kinase KinB [Candidatus Hydrogenedentes bacterium]|nr:two-component system, NtrC family, sensor histidine kinase KinB [Candidatus Hydrogenedentota bacterium]
MLGLRSKLSLGFGGLLLIILIIGVEAILRVNELGQSIDVILRENYRSVLASQEMKECLERVDSGILFVLLGYEREGRAQIEEYLGKFEKAMNVEGGNITLRGEKESFAALQSSYRQYLGVLKEVGASSRPVVERRGQYFTQLLPLFQSIKQSADEILRMNQQNMSDANMIARKEAAEASQRMYLLLICGVVMASFFVLYTGRWILYPITALTVSANEIARGNLDLVVGTSSRDEMGQLSRAFDAMASNLRQYRRTNEARLFNMQRATQQAMDSLSAPIAVVDLEGTVEAVTKAAHEAFDLEAGSTLQESKYPWMNALLQQVLQSGRREHLGKGDCLIQVFVQGQERFFRPEAIPVLDGLGQIAGVTLILNDATQVKQQDDLKRGLVSTVSHQLKTPLTSIRMALYLLLDDKLGPLTPKQEELLVAARDDSDRLYTTVEDLLDIARIQSGRIQMDLRNADAAVLALDAIEPFKTQAQNGGIILTTSLPPGLPEVQADLTRVPHVFANLISNAIKYTSPGGRITVSARPEDDAVWFSVSDTGSGIPLEYQARVFEQFFRVPQEGKGSGAGLGLAIAKEIVTAHGGEIRVESLPGNGSTFSFSLKKAAIAAALEKTA